MYVEEIFKTIINEGRQRSVKGGKISILKLVKGWKGRYAYIINA